MSFARRPLFAPIFAARAARRRFVLSPACPLSSMRMPTQSRSSSMDAVPRMSMYQKNEYRYDDRTRDRPAHSNTNMTNAKVRITSRKTSASFEGLARTQMSTKKRLTMSMTPKATCVTLWLINQSISRYVSRSDRRGPKLWSFFLAALVVSLTHCRDMRLCKKPLFLWAMAAVCISPAASPPMLLLVCTPSLGDASCDLLPPSALCDLRGDT
mmetsp:Transcript_11148/g.33923  ORF Transcript_11148/g.33923 Transcript_11148/m.33923 type:complete len:212 (-) Transcript_11148:353-988(-)